MPQAKRGEPPDEIEDQPLGDRQARRIREQRERQDQRIQDDDGSAWEWHQMAPEHGGDGVRSPSNLRTRRCSETGKGASVPHAMLWTPHRFWAAVGQTVAFASLAIGCAHPGFDGTTYRDGEIAFRVGPVPPSWHRIEVSEARLAFRDDQAHSLIAVGGRCHRDGDDVPLEALTHHLFLHFTDRHVVRQELLSLDGREALRTEISAELDGVPRSFVVFVLKKDGCVYDFMLITPPDALEQSQQDFERFVTGFSTLDRS
jgi:hypothetical protein